MDMKYVLMLTERNVMTGEATKMLLETGFKEPMYYVFETENEALKALNSPALEGKLSEDKKSKSFYDGLIDCWVKYSVEKVHANCLKEKM